VANETNTDKAVAFVVDNWDALGVEEQGGVLYLPAKIKRRKVDGSVDETEVRLRNVTNHHKFTCRALARDYAKGFKLDVDRDASFIDEIENYALLAFAIRDPKPPYDQHVPNLPALIDTYDAQSLAEIWGRYNAWVEMLDPRFGEMSEDDLWNCIVRIATEKNAGFLAAIPGYAQATSIVFMAREALSSPRRPSWLQSSETSKPVS
jgi:hypothetical protein